MCAEISQSFFFLNYWTKISSRMIRKRIKSVFVFWSAKPVTIGDLASQQCPAAGHSVSFTSFPNLSIIIPFPAALKKPQFLPLCCQMPLNFVTKAFSYNVVRFWASLCCKLYNILPKFGLFLRIHFQLFLASFAFLFLSPPFLFMFYPLSPFCPLEKVWPQPF